MMRRLIIFSIVVVIILGLGYAGVRFGLAKYREYKEEQIRKQLSFQILEGATASAPVVVEVDYKKQISTGSPLIFGGSQSPDYPFAPLIEHKSAWDKIKDVGVTMIREDFNINYAIRNTNIELYRKNFDNIQDVSNWHQSYLSFTSSKFTNAKLRQLKTMGIAGFTPPWLAYNNTDFGVPKDWDIFKDIVKKNYKIYRKNLDFIEIWNEPSYNFFLDPSNSPYTREEAYKMIFKISTEAIREVDKDANDGKLIKIGGPASHRPFDTSVLEVILKDSNLREELDFISYHNYDQEHLKEPSWIYFKDILKKYNKQNLPIFITEWNYSPDSKQRSPYHTSNLAITYTGDKFIDFLKMGLAGANYHALWPLDITKPDKGEGLMGFYRWENGKAELLPQAKTWRILSKSMGLGAGESRVMETTHPDTINSVGFINSKGEEGVAIVNDSGERQLVELNLNNGNVENRARIDVYFASELYDGGKPVHSHVVEMLGKDLKYRLIVPRDTVAGIKITPEHRWYDFIDKLVE